MSRWIAISGYKGSGKDTFAEHFVANGFTKINFADNLKELCAYAFHIHLDSFYDQSKKEVPLTCPVVIDTDNLSRVNEWISRTHSFAVPDSFIGVKLETPRLIMQNVGTEMIRTTYENYHAEATLAMMKEHKDVVCSDVRFMNELVGMRDLAKELGYAFVSVYVERPGYGGDAHISENSIVPTDMMLKVVNDNTIAELLELADTVLAHTK